MIKIREKMEIKFPFLKRNSFEGSDFYNEEERKA